MRYGDFLALASLLTAIACGGHTSTGAATDGGMDAAGGSGGAGASTGSGGVDAASGSGGIDAASGAGGLVATGGSAAGGSAGTGGSDGGGCVPPAPGDLSGSYLFTLSTAVNPALPILFVAQARTVTAGGGSALKLTLQALDAKDRKTQVGNAIDLPPIAIGSDGQLEATTQLQLPVDGRANPIQVGLSIVATVTLHGQVCGVADFYCGTVGGQVTQPIPIALAGSTYTLERIATPASLPDPPLIDCAKHPAGPPP